MSWNSITLRLRKVVLLVAVSLMAATGFLGCSGTGGRVKGGGEIWWGPPREPNPNPDKQPKEKKEKGWRYYRDPDTGTIYGYDPTSKKLYKYNPDTGEWEELGTFQPYELARAIGVDEETLATMGGGGATLADYGLIPDGEGYYRYWVLLDNLSETNPFNLTANTTVDLYMDTVGYQDSAGAGWCLPWTRPENPRLDLLESIGPENIWEYHTAVADGVVAEMLYEGITLRDAADLLREYGVTQIDHVHFEADAVIYISADELVIDFLACPDGLDIVIPLD